MMRRRKRGIVAGAVLTATAMLSTACGQFEGIYDLPLPGGADTGNNPYHVTVRFTDALNLVPHSAVKVDDVPVGTVSEIDLQNNGWQDGWTAEVDLTINGDVTLPANAVARIRQSSLLGEKFVELAAPADVTGSGKNATRVTVPEHARLTDGTVIPAGRTDVGVEVEQIFGALSMLLNGGGVAQLRNINHELSEVMTGNEQEVRAFLANMEEMISSLDSNRQAITRALDSMDRLAKRLADRDEKITTALNELSPGLHSLTEQRDQLVKMLDALDKLSDVAVDTIHKSKDNVVADLKAMAPILRRLTEAGSDLPKALEILPTFPFTDAALDAIKGDYMNTFVRVEPWDGYEEPIPPLEPPDDMSSDSDGDSGGSGDTGETDGGNG